MQVDNHPTNLHTTTAKETTAIAVLELSHHVVILRKCATSGWNKYCLIRINYNVARLRFDRGEKGEPFCLVEMGDKFPDVFILGLGSTMTSKP